MFYVEVPHEQCQKCKSDDSMTKAELATRAVDGGVERDRDVMHCDHAGRVLQGLVDGCCKDGKVVPKLIVCTLLDKPVSVYSCYACRNFKKNSI